MDRHVTYHLLQSSLLWVTNPHGDNKASFIDYSVRKNEIQPARIGQQFESITNLP